MKCLSFILLSFFFVFGIQANDLNSPKIIKENPIKNSSQKMLTPLNDDPCNAEDLTGGGTAVLNTTEGAGADYIDLCANTDLTNTVWFKVVAPFGVDGIEISINNINTTGLVGSQVYLANPDGCLPTDITTDPDNFDCDSLLTERKYVLTYWEDGDVFYIKVSSTDDGAGEFELIVEEKNKSCEYANLCTDITLDQILAPISPANDYEAPIPYCLSSCLDYANPEEAGVVGCDFTSTEVVWFQVDVGGNSNTMNILITTGGWTGAVALFDGTDCSDLTQLGNCKMGTPGAISFPGNDINGSQSYWIGITYESGPLDDPSFDICVTTSPYYVECSINQEITVTARTNDPNGDLGLSLDGPFCPGETISFCYDLDFDPTETNCQWFQGIVPKFGSAWDKTSFDGVDNLPTPGSGWDWYPDADVFYQEASPFLCTYMNADGELDLCYPMFEVGCPCSQGSPPYSPLPAGWFYYSPGSGSTCTNTGHPNTGWGYPRGCSAITHFQVCFDIDVKSYTDFADCEADGDLSIGFYPFADGEIGCWAEEGDTKCNGDISAYKFYEIECKYEEVFLSGIVISDTILNNYSFEFMGSVTGEVASWFWDFGDGNTSSEPSPSHTFSKDSTYMVCLTISNGCNIFDKTCIEVNIIQFLPLSYSITIMDLLCFEDTIGAIIIIPEGGAGNYDISWVGPDNFTSTEFTINNLKVGSYIFTLNDSIGTILIDTVELSIPSQIEGEVTIINTSEDQDDGMIELTVSGGIPPYSYLWSNGSSKQNLLNIASGEYDVVIYDSNNCELHLGPYTVYSPLSYSIITMDILCFDDTTGTIIIIPDGSDGNYDISWVGSDNYTSTEFNIENLKVGTYIFTLKDSIGTILIDTIGLSGPSQMEGEVNITNTSEVQNDGMIELTVSGGVPPYTFLWSNGSQEQSLINITNGEYSVVVIDSNKCRLHLGTYIVKSPLSYSISTIDILCFDDTTGTILIVPHGSDGNYNISWVGPDDFTSTEFNISNLKNGNYIFTLNGGTGPILKDTIELSSPSQLEGEVNITNTNGDQSDGMIELTVSGGIPPYTFLWSNGSSEQNLMNITSGEYDVVIIDSNNCELLLGPYTVEMNTGTNNINNIIAFDLYPNPVDKLLTLNVSYNLALNSSYSIYQKNGKFITKKDLGYGLTVNSSIDVSGFSSGVYILVLESDSGITSHEFIVVR